MFSVACKQHVAPKNTRRVSIRNEHPENLPLRMISAKRQLPTDQTHRLAQSSPLLKLLFIRPTQPTHPTSHVPPSSSRTQQGTTNPAQHKTAHLQTHNLGHTPHNTAPQPAQTHLHPPPPQILNSPNPERAITARPPPQAATPAPVAPNHPTTILHSVPSQLSPHSGLPRIHTPPTLGKITHRPFSCFVTSLIDIHPLLLLPTPSLQPCSCRHIIFIPQ